MSLAVLFALVLIGYRFFGKAGLYGLTVFCTAFANIEVLMTVNAFGMEQTLGNVLFACGFLITDILSENEGKKEADKAVALGIATSVCFLLVTQSWLLFRPSENDWAAEPIRTLFSASPRILLASLAVYALVQWLDVRLYHAVWRLTEKKCGNGKRYLWLRNNAATLLSQLINTVLFHFAAFAGTFPVKTLVSMIAASYLIFIVTSLCDTPVAYLARRFKQKGKII